jgi:hypothetical protein
MKKIATILLLSLTTWAFAQIPPVTIEPYGGNKRASVSEQIGIVKIEINYNRPGVKGREGKIWDTSLAHYGLVDLGHGTSYASPWRAGANENTTMYFSHPVKIEGHDLPAGKYGFFINLGETESTLIFSKVNNSWGSFYYDATQDALQVKVKNQVLDKSVEWLTYEFTEQADSSAVIAMSWEKRKIPFRVDVERKKLQIEAFKNDFRITRSSNDFIDAADWCVRNNYDLKQALEWMDRAIYFRVMGEKNFRTLSEKAAVLNKMNRLDDAKKVMVEAIPLGNMVDVHFYARTLLNNNQPKNAFAAFKANYDKYPQEYTTNIGMARAHSALGEYKKASVFLKFALPKAPDDANKIRVEAMIKQLESNTDINK